MASVFSKQFLKNQNETLKADRASTEKQIVDLRKEDPFLDPDHAIDNAAVDTDVREQAGHDSIEAQIKDLTRKLRDIDIALEKSDKNRYGYCEKCSMQIPMPRLELIAEARFCIECERKLYK